MLAVACGRQRRWERYMTDNSALQTGRIACVVLIQAVAGDHVHADYAHRMLAQPVYTLFITDHIIARKVRKSHLSICLSICPSVRLFVLLTFEPPAFNLHFFACT